jgi:CheY-like chemotaxis protein
MGIKAIMRQFEGLSNAKYRVLLVEDQPIVRIIHSNFLQSLDCVVLCVSNGHEALALINEENNFDIIFMDMGLPDISGIEVVKAYRKTEKYQNFPIIALTAYGGKDDKQKFLEAGVDEVVVKPVTIQQLNLVLQRHIVQPQDIL